MVFQRKSFQKFLATAMTASIVASAFVPSASAASFPDVSGQYTDAVDYLVTNEISDGLANGTFGTHESIKRADAAIWVVRALGYENIKAPDSGFTDVPDRAENAVNVLKDLEIINGKTETNFGSHDSLTRAEMAKIIANAYDLQTEGKKHPFKDVSPTFTDYVQAVYHAGITVGKGNTTYGSSDPTKRGEFAVFLVKADQYEEVVPNVVVSEVTGVVNDDNTVTITGKATEIDQVTVVLPDGDKKISLESDVLNGQFSVTTEMPASGINEITIVDSEGKVLYEGVTDQVVAAGIEFKISSVNE